MSNNEVASFNAIAGREISGRVTIDDLKGLVADDNVATEGPVVTAISNALDRIFPPDQAPAGNLDVGHNLTARERAEALKGILESELKEVKPRNTDHTTENLIMERFSRLYDDATERWLNFTEQDIYRLPDPGESILNEVRKVDAAQSTLQTRHSGLRQTSLAWNREGRVKGIAYAIQQGRRRGSKGRTARHWRQDITYGVLSRLKENVQGIADTRQIKEVARASAEDLKARLVLEVGPLKDDEVRAIDEGLRRFLLYRQPDMKLLNDALDFIERKAGFDEPGTARYRFRSNIKGEFSYDPQSADRRGTGWRRPRGLA